MADQTKFIVRYISQKVTGYSPDFSRTYLLCEVRYSDGTTATITEVRSSSSGAKLNWEGGRR